MIDLVESYAKIQNIKEITIIPTPTIYSDINDEVLLYALKWKKFVEIDGCWGEVIVKKDDLLYFIDEVNNRMMEEKDVLDNRSERDKVMEIDDNRNYRLVAIES